MPSVPENFDAYPVIPSHAAPQAVYVHVPFCLHRCGYCDFTLVAKQDELIPRWLDALERELSRMRHVHPVNSVFVGGGTPTHLSVPDLQRLFEMILKHFKPQDDAEISIEANPDGLDNDRLNILQDYGVNRLSLGVQSFHPEVLQTLERQHNADQAIDVIHRAAERFANISLDLIFGVPGQTPEIWNQTLQTALQLPLSHISTYGLTFESGTDFFRRLKHGRITPANEETERSMYAAAMDVLPAAGFPQYEISNFARPTFECRHNHVYWTAGEYFAFGPGAARYVSGIRSTNARSVTHWIQSWNSDQPAFHEVEELTQEEKIREAVFLGLRLVRGINLQEFEHRFGKPVDVIEPVALQRHCADGLLEVVNGHLRLSHAGRFLADTVVTDFL